MRLIYKISISLLLFILAFALTNQAKAQQSLYIDKQEYSCATTFDIALRTTKISNVIAMQGTVSWDTAVLKFNGISFNTSAITLDGTNMNLSATSNGYLTFLWYDNSLKGKSVNDATMLFTINLHTNGSGKGKGIVKFVNYPTQLEIDTLDAGNNPVNNTTAGFMQGYIVTPSFYTFTGTGNWNLAANWKNNNVPPGILPACSEIFINPLGSQGCILDNVQIISPGAKITVIAGKKLTIAGNLTLQ